MVINIKNSYALEPERIGNKAYYLNQLYQRGYPICDGYVITNDFFYRFFISNSIKQINYDIISRIRSGKFDTVSYIELKKLFCSLSKRTGAVIVRSSAVEEDSFNKSFAGIFESVTEVKQFDDMLDAIKEVWCSYFSVYAKEYRDTDELHAMPVLIQEMEYCDRSGVVFTRNPVKNEDELVIEACQGNNQEIMNGDKKAERFVLSSDLRQRITPGILSKKEILKIARMAKQLEKEFQFSSDIEWGIVNRKIIIFQLRPIVLMPIADIYHTLKEDHVDGILLDRYASPACVCYLSLLNDWQRKVYLSYYSKRSGDALEEKALLFLNNRVYWNVKYQKTYFEDTGKESVRKRIKFQHLTRQGYKNWYSRLNRYDKKVKEYKKAIINTKDYGQLLTLLDQIIQNFCCYLGIDHFRFLGISQVLYHRLDACMKDMESDKRSVFRLIGKITNKNETIKANLELQDMARDIQNNQPLYDVFMQKEENEILDTVRNRKEFTVFANHLTVFLDKHGHRGTECDDIYYPHWNENPEKVISLIKQLLLNSVLDEPEVEDDTERIMRKYKKYKRLIQLTGEYMCLRENQRYYFDKSWVLIRQVLLLLSGYFIENKMMDNQSDIFHLTIGEIHDTILQKNHQIPATIIQKRKELFKKAKLAIPPYIYKDSERVEVQKSTRSKSYKAIGISAGKVSGSVRIVNGLHELGSVEKNDIAVIKTFHPSWTPILKIVSGIIMNYGNMLSHGAVVAREYGIPVVVFNGDAEKVLKNKDKVEIDGSTGRIKILVEGNDDDD